MNIRTLISAVIFLLPLSLVAQDTPIDTLFNRFEQTSAKQRSSLTSQLISSFEKDEMYDYPVTTKHRSDRDFSQALVYLGYANYALDCAKFQQSVHYGEKALTLFDKDSLRWLSSCYEALNVALQRQGDFSKALKYTQKDYEIGLSLDDRRIQSSALNSLAAINLSTEHFEEALNLIDQAIALERDNPDNQYRSLSIRLGIKSEILMSMDKPEEALTCIDEAIKIEEAAGRIDKMHIRSSQKADVLMRLGQWEECRDISLNNLEYFDTTQNAIEQVITLKQLGMCEKGMKHYAAAENYLLRGNKLCEEIGARPLQWRILHQLYLIKKETNQLGEAVSYLERSTAIRDSLDNEKYQKALSEYQVAYETREKEAKILEQEKSLHNHLIWFLVLLILLILITIIVFVSLRLSSMRKKHILTLEESNRNKNQVFSILSHDLKNPVQAQKRMLDLICAHYDDISDKDKKQQLIAVKESSESLSDLLANLLDWASLESGRLVYKPIRIDLYSVIKENIRRIQPLANAKNITISSSIPQNLYVMADINFLGIVFYNLLHNAIKFSFKDGTVEVEAEENNAIIYLRVIDHGVGMDEEEKNLIFNRNKISTHGTAGEVGTGIGLLVCKELINRSGNHISFTSEQKKGTTFTFTLKKTDNPNINL